MFSCIIISVYPERKLLSGSAHSYLGMKTYNKIDINSTTNGYSLNDGSSFFNIWTLIYHFGQ